MNEKVLILSIGSVTVLLMGVIVRSVSHQHSPASAAPARQTPAIIRKAIFAIQTASISKSIQLARA